MQETEYTQKAALFFYFFFLDEAKAQAATILALKKIKSTFSNEHKGVSPAVFVQITSAISVERKIYSGLGLRRQSSRYIQLPDKSNWGPWFEFRKTIDDGVSQVMIYTQLLGVEAHDVASGLGLSLGTIDYRVARGLRFLGDLCRRGGLTLAV
jgi:hypothetical protein